MGDAGGCTHTATHCNPLQHTATRCNTVQHPTHQAAARATREGTLTLQRTATCCNTLQHPTYRQQHGRRGKRRSRSWCNSKTSKLCSADSNLHRPRSLYECAMLHISSSLQQAATQCNTLQHIDAGRYMHEPCRTFDRACSTLQHNATHCNTLQHTNAGRHMNEPCHTFD